MSALSNCRECGRELDPDRDDWQQTVNLTPDLLAVEGHFYEFVAVMDVGDGIDWCDVQCFGIWLTRAVRP